MAQLRKPNRLKRAICESCRAQWVLLEPKEMERALTSPDPLLCLPCKMQQNPDTPPSKTTDASWIYARPPNWESKQTGRTGKWMLFPRKEELDTVWSKIAKATEDGLLGIAAKTSTARPRSYSSEVGLICVYTYDADDVSDVKRVLGQLRALGFNDRLNYKEDEQTRLGNYAQDNPGAVSIFTSPADSLELTHPRRWNGRRLV